MSLNERELAGLLKGIAGPIRAFVEEKILLLEERIAELEQREYQGVWRADQAYAKHAMVTRQGSVWHSNKNGNRSMPGVVPYEDWTLAVKAGKDGKDAVSS